MCSSEALSLFLPSPPNPSSQTSRPGELQKDPAARQFDGWNEAVTALAKVNENLGAGRGWWHLKLPLPGPLQ